MARQIHKLTPAGSTPLSPKAHLDTASMEDSHQLRGNRQPEDSVEIRLIGPNSIHQVWIILTLMFIEIGHPMINKLGSREESSQWRFHLRSRKWSSTICKSPNLESSRDQIRSTEMRRVQKLQRYSDWRQLILRHQLLTLRSRPRTVARVLETCSLSSRTNLSTRLSSSQRSQQALRLIRAPCNQGTD